MTSMPQATLRRPDTGPPWESAVIISEIKISLSGPLNSSPTGKLTRPTASPPDPPPRYSQELFDPEALKQPHEEKKTHDEERTLQAWLQIFASFLLLVNGYGYYSSFGAFQSHWQTTLARSPADISWTGSVQLSLPLVGAVSGRLMDQGYFRSLLVAGCLLQLVGILVTSFVERPGQFAQLLLAQGVVQGLGNGILFTPCVTLVSLYFVRYRAFALGVASCGGAGRRGGLHDARELAVKIGHPWTIRVMGLVVLFNCAVILAIAKPKAIDKPVSAPWFDSESWKDSIYVLFAVGIFFVGWGLNFASFFIASYGTKIIGLEPSESLLLLLIMNAVGVPGRLAPALLTDLYCGSFALLVPFAAAVGTALLGWLAAYSEPSYVAFVVLYGVCANAVQTLLPSALAGLTADPAKMGVRTGMAFTVLSVACLSGPPIAGALIALDGGRYRYAQAFGGLSVLGGAGILGGCKWNPAPWLPSTAVCM
ncbi:Aspyridones efflux protein apdF [Apiospora phragmitis]|uniref:Aspyridones efflux protein apdF n=1 Tax=Apiospora phragmitis TaxID=2905665 RepID=A0ABR1VWB7_9PEZI